MDPNRLQLPDQILATGYDLKVEAGLRKERDTYRCFSISVTIEGPDFSTVDNARLFVIRREAELPSRDERLAVYLMDSTNEHGRELTSISEDRASLDDIGREKAVELVVRQALLGSFNMVTPQASIGESELYEAIDELATEEQNDQED